MTRNFAITFIVMTMVGLIPIAVATDISVWQGQYYTGTTFHQGTFNFDFIVYDAKENGNICYSNTTILTTGVFGEWKTEQAGIGFACNNASKDYFLEIKIDNVKNGDRKLLTIWDYLRKDANDIIGKNITIKGVAFGSEAIQSQGGLSIETNDEIAHTSTQLTIKNTNNGSLSGSNIKIINNLGHFVQLGIGSSENKLTDPKGSTGGLGYSGGSAFGFTNIGNADWFWKVVDISNFPVIAQNIVMRLSPTSNITFALLSDNGRFLIPKAGVGLATWNSRSMMIGGNLDVSSASGINETRVLCSAQGFTKIDCDANLTGADLGVQDDLEVKDTGFFSFLGNLTNRVTTLFVKSIDVPDNATIADLKIKRYDAFGTAILTNNDDAIRIFASPNITNPTNGAGIQLFGNNEGFFPADVFIDAGSKEGGEITMRTGATGLNNRVVIEDSGRVKILNLTGVGDDYLCVDSEGYLFRKNEVC